MSTRNTAVADAPTGKTRRKGVRKAPTTVALTLDDVELVTTEDLAAMTEPQVLALPEPAQRRRLERLRSDTTTEWGIMDVAGFFGVTRATVSSWRWQFLRGEQRVAMRLPEPVRILKRPGRGKASPIWLLAQIVGWGAESERSDRDTLVPFPDGRKPPGRTPDGHTMSGLVPEQRTKRTKPPIAA